MPEENKTYQLTLFLPASLGEAEAKETVGKIRQMIEQKGGEIKKAPTFEISVAEDKTGKISLDKFKRELAYPIKKNRVVFCFNIDFSLSEELMADLRRQLDTENAVIRYLAAVKNPLAAGPEPISNAKLNEKIESLIDKEIPLPEKPAKRTVEPEQEAAPGTAFPSGKSKAKIEDLDKKLEEILNQ